MEFSRLAANKGDAPLGEQELQVGGVEQATGGDNLL